MLFYMFIMIIWKKKKTKSVLPSTFAHSVISCVPHGNGNCGLYWLFRDLPPSVYNLHIQSL